MCKVLGQMLVPGVSFILFYYSVWYYWDQHHVHLKEWENNTSICACITKTIHNDQNTQLEIWTLFESLKSERIWLVENINRACKSRRNPSPFPGTLAPKMMQTYDVILLICHLKSMNVAEMFCFSVIFEHWYLVIRNFAFFLRDLHTLLRHIHVPHNLLF